MKVFLEIPDAEVVKAEWAPEGVSLVRAKQDPLVSFKSELRFFVRDEWVKEQCPATKILWPDVEALDVECSLIKGHAGAHADESMGDIDWEDSE